MNKFKLSMLTLALAAAGTSSMVFAQETADAQTQQAQEEAIEVISVTGFRGSLQRAQAVKMSESSVVEVLSAEDIGKLPDTSIAESLARLPGLAGERRNGRTSGLSVRGFNENYVGTSLNGRELLGMGDNRGVEYDLYPSEIVSTAIVYKTPDASLVAQGIGGTVNLETVSPLRAEATRAVNLNLEKNAEDSGNPDYDNNGHRISFNFVDKFLDDKLGLAFVVSSNGRFGDTYKISETLTSLYGLLQINTEISDMPVQGNVGVRIVQADQSGVGYNTFSNAQGFTNALDASGDAKYTDVLPSLNVSVEVADRQYVRTSLSKVQSRPRMDQMRPNSQVTFQFNDSNVLSTNPENSPWGGNSGNTALKPLEANQFDLSYENYYHDNGYFAASFFYKDLTNWHRSETVLTDFSEFYIPGFHRSSEETGFQPPALFVGGLSVVSDGLTGFVRGYELQASVPFEILHPSLYGFGIVASATFMDGELSDGQRIPGLSEEIYSLTAYYEYAGFEFRISGTKRDAFLTETRGLSLALDSVVDRGAELWDAQIGYDFTESNIDWLAGLRVTLQVQNITNEKTVQTNGSDPRQITLFQSFGTNYMLGLNYKF
ncbi:TonB-dependent receptor domain-containing protein [Alishewanella longhuensis]